MRVLIADDQRLLRESFKNIIENNSDIKVVACAANGREAYELCGEFYPDVVLMDISMPICSGTEATRLIKAKYPNIHVLILTSSEDEGDVSDAISSGANGYILKNVSAEELILSIKGSSLGLQIIDKDLFKQSTLHLTNSPESEKIKSKTIEIEGIDISLTEREIKIIELIVDGHSNKQISAELFIAEGTVKNKITEIIAKLQLNDRTQLAVYAIRKGLI